QQPDANSVPDCATAGVLGATTATMGALMATQAIGYLSGVGTTQPGEMLSYDAFPPVARTYRVLADFQRSLTDEPLDSYQDRDTWQACTVSMRALELLEAARLVEYISIDIRDPHEVLLADISTDIASQKLPLSSLDGEDVVE